MKKILCFILFIVISLSCASIAEEECQHKNIGISEYWEYDYYDETTDELVNLRFMTYSFCIDCRTYIGNEKEMENPYISSHNNHELNIEGYQYAKGILVLIATCETCGCSVTCKIDHTCDMTNWKLVSYNYENKYNLYERYCKDERCSNVEFLKVYGYPIIENLPDEKDEDITPVQIYSINNNPITIGSYTVNNICYIAPWSKYQKHDHEWTSMKYWGKDEYGNETYEFICECGAICFAHDGDFVDNNKGVKTITIIIKGIKIEFTPEEYEELKAQIN